ncbi:MAG: AI-2E family transporter [Synergistota bacterium]|nr:AI-2E family transporter [Synergistota bacterium]
MRYERVLVTFTGLIAIVLLGAVLREAKGVFLPLVIAWLLYFLFAPAVRFLSARKIPVSVSTVLVVAVFVALCTVSILFLNTRVASLAEAYPRYYERIQTFAVSALGNLDIPTKWWEGVSIGQFVGQKVLAFSGLLMSFLSNMILVVLFLVFLLLGGAFSDNKIDLAFSTETGSRVRNVVRCISSQISCYLFLQFLISLATGFLAWCVFALMGLDFAITWGVLTFLLNFIPTLGSFVAAIPPILTALAQFLPDIGPAIIIAVCLLVLQQIIGGFISPKIMGDRLNLSPVTILMSLLLWGWLWGVPGAILSVPIASAIKIICDNVPQLRPVGVFMSSGKRGNAKTSGNTARPPCP